MNQHEMNSTSKILTVIGLVFEGFSALMSITMGLILTNIENFAFFEFVVESVEPEDQFAFELMIGPLAVFVLITGILVMIMFIVNLVLFIRLLKGRYIIDTAKKVYKYQIIWGIISLFLNSITGILYLISGFQGHEGIRKQSMTQEDN